MFTTTLAEVVAVNGRVLDVKPLFSPDGVTMPVITGVQLGMFGNVENNIDVNIKTGDIIIVLFTTFDISNFVTLGSKERMDTSRRNDLNSCIALPFTFNKHSSTLPLPTSIRMTGNREEQGNVEHVGNIVITGMAQAANVAATTSLKVAEKEMKGHIHTNGTNSQGNTGQPI